MSCKKELAFKIQIKYKSKDQIVYVIAPGEEIVFAGEAGDFYGK